jgi:hypothetical protein
MRWLSRAKNIKQVVPNPSLLFLCKLSGADIELPIDLNGVDVNDLAVKVTSQRY